MQRTINRELPCQSSGKSISQSSQCSSTEIRQHVPWKRCVTALIPVWCLHLLNVLWETCKISDPLKVDDLLPPNRKETEECYIVPRRNLIISCPELLSEMIRDVRGKNGLAETECSVRTDWCHILLLLQWETGKIWNYLLLYLFKSCHFTLQGNY